MGRESLGTRFVFSAEVFSLRILRRPLAGLGQPVPADGDVRRHDQVRGAEQAALANQAARGVAHRELEYRHHSCCDTR